jgi:hypothetical protein
MYSHLEDVSSVFVFPEALSRPRHGMVSAHVQEVLCAPPLELIL